MENSSVDVNIHSEDEDEGGNKPQNIVEGNEDHNNEYHHMQTLHEEIDISDQHAGLFDNCMCRCIL